MTDDNSNNDNETPNQQDALPSFKLGDDLIAVIRELVQLTVLTGTNIVDHLRAVDCNVDPGTGKLVPTEDYIVAYNEMVEELSKQAEEASEAMIRETVATEAPSVQASVIDIDFSGVQYGDASDDDDLDVN